ncbi:MAG: 2-oxo acid dehydrogenase subunit E2 [Acidobacteria bacterium]|nr:2-oxo acid dehydrogenase subunit E2 [Acidobacteriota bacterium]
MPTPVKLPALGENIDSADVVNVLVAPGETVAKDQPLLEVETGKASVEIPSPASGVVKDVLAKTGDTVAVGGTILTLEGADNTAAASAPPATDSTDEPAAAGNNADRILPAAQPQPTSSAAAKPLLAAEAQPRLSEVPEPGPSGRRLVPAAPTVRRFARQVGVEITEVRGSGPGGRISIDDVKAHAKRLLSAPAGSREPARELPDFTRWGDVELQPMSSIRKLTAQAMAYSWANVPQVTHHDLADITRLEELRQRYGPRVEAAGGKLTMTAILVKVVASALAVFPKFNASVDVAAQRIIRKLYINVGVAVDTDRGLLVPVIKNAGTKSIATIAAELVELATRARERKLSADELQGATFSVSNLGGIGGTGFDPIVNWPEAAVLGVSRAQMQPVWNSESFQPRLLLPLCVTYDHRLIDGADAARFLHWVCEALEEPILLSLE